MTITVNGVTYRKEELEALSREALRTVARAAHKERNSSVSLTWLGSAAKSADLIAFILDEERDYGFAGQQTFPEPSVAHPTPRGTASETTALATLASALQGFMKPEVASVDVAQVESIVSGTVKACREELVKYVDKSNAETFEKLLGELNGFLANSTKTVRIELGQSEPVTLSGLRHANYDDLVADVCAFKVTGQMARANFWLVGPAGTGKTTAAEKLAQALGLPFFFNGAIDSEYKLRGFIDAQGRIVSTAFRKAYTEGGVYLFDEVDSSLPAACLAFNAALANGCYDFPGDDMPVQRHSNCIVLAASNTWGGPSGGYVGRFRQDAAFMDRFMRVEWPTDEKLERALCSNQDWCAFVQCARAGAIANGIEHLISPRATLNGDALLAAGRPWDRVVELCVRKGLNDADWSKINRTN